jgi:hypothetical protein
MCRLAAVNRAHISMTTTRFRLALFKQHGTMEHVRATRRALRAKSAGLAILKPYRLHYTAPDGLALRWRNPALPAPLGIFPPPIASQGSTSFQASARHWHISGTVSLTKILHMS